MVTSNGEKSLVDMHNLLLEALRHREQEIFRYLAILVPALGAFVWLSLESTKTMSVSASMPTVFIVGTVGVLLLLLLGAVYSLALGYNYRCIVLELAKIESALNIKDNMLVGWPKSRQDFLDRYKLFCSIPWCTPPEMIKIFWWAFLLGIVWVTVAACLFKSEHSFRVLLIHFGTICFIIGLLSPIYFGCKLRKLCAKEPREWS